MTQPNEPIEGSTTTCFWCGWVLIVRDGVVDPCPNCFEMIITGKEIIKEKSERSVN